MLSVSTWHGETDGKQGLLRALVTGIALVTFAGCQRPPAPQNEAVSLPTRPKVPLGPWRGIPELVDVSVVPRGDKDEWRIRFLIENVGNATLVLPRRPSEYKWVADPAPEIKRDEFFLPAQGGGKWGYWDSSPPPVDLRCEEMFGFYINLPKSRGTSRLKFTLIYDTFVLTGACEIPRQEAARK